MSKIEELRAELAAKNARIAEWKEAHHLVCQQAEKAEAKLDALQRTYQFDVRRLVSERDQEKSRAEWAEARVAELETANSEIAVEALRDHRELHARAEKAEATLSAHIDKGTLQALRDANDRAERAEAERDALREATQELIARLESSWDRRDILAPDSDLEAVERARAALSANTP